MIISCPHCQTKYQVTYEAIGATGRKVQCAHCQEAWQQSPLPKDEPPPAPEVRKAEEVIAEDGLDEAMATEERAADLLKRAGKKSAKADKAAAAGRVAGKMDPAEVRRRQKNFSRRQSSMMSELPVARLRRIARVLAVLALAGTAAGAYFGRVQIVQQFPSMAAVYDRIGLGVNVVGLDFTGLSTLRTTRNGKEMLIVSAQIVGLRASPAPVPSVVVTLLDEHGATVYQWSVDPLVHDLMAGERATLDTQLSQPPAGAVRIRLAFAESALPAVAGAEAAAEDHGAAGDAHGAADAHGATAETGDAHGAAAETGDAHGGEAAPADAHGAAATEGHAAPAADGHAAPGAEAPAAEAHGATDAHGATEPAAADHAAPAGDAHGEPTSDAAAGHGAATPEPATPEHH
ncbi:zinc-ribbon domain-containing protein [Devosia sp. FKR38]|uniref:zinc-ribbon domain-containing protein n=1 Tax=Devosia sp. FKR38 TaxID=2562312 RepID=UPI0010C01D36|nr:zinc-ribbon domain-containing protein [Devosia sp. FKR38]